MARLPGFRREFRFPWRTRTQIDRDLDAELAFHLEMRTAELVDRGMTPKAARQEALRQFGDLADTKRYCRTVDGAAEQRTRRTRCFDELRQDLRYAVRGLVKSPGFTAVALVTLALGIGVNTVIFSAVNAILLREMPVAQPHELVDIHIRSIRSESLYGSLSYQDFVSLRDGNETLSGMFAVGHISVRATLGNEPEQLTGEIVSGNYFDVLGVRPALGRGFLEGEDITRGTHPVVVISHGLWQRQFGGDPDIIDRTIILNEIRFTVVGVAPPEFRSSTLAQASDLWVPMAMQATMRRPSAGLRRSLGGDDLLGSRGASWVNATGRLSPGTSRQQASVDLNFIAERLAEAFPDSNRDRRINLTGHNDGSPFRRVLGSVFMLLSGITGLVLLIACANITNLLLARATTRGREIAIRLALGIDRMRLVRQLLTESAVLALAGGVVGVGLAAWAVGLINTVGLPSGFGTFVTALDISIDGRVLTYTAGLSLLTGVMFGLVPALQSSRADFVGALKDEGGGGSGGAGMGRGAARLRHSFVVGQVAVSFVLVIATGLLLRTFFYVRTVDPGFAVENRLLATVSLDLPRYSEDAGRLFYGRLKEGLEAQPGIESVSMARTVSLGGASRRYGIAIEGHDPDERHQVRANVVGADFLKTMAIPLLRGRDFDPSDRPESPGVAIITEAMAERFWPDEDPIGQRFIQGSTPVEVIGVARNSKQVSLRDDRESFYYRPLSQLYESGVTLHIRTTGEPAQMAAAVRRTVQRLEPNLPISNVRTMAQQFDVALAPERLATTLITVFGVLAAVLAMVGVYGVIAYSVTQRTHEIGVRVALGAEHRTIFGLIVRHGITMVLVGSAIGAAMALAATRLLAGLLFGVSPTDPATFLAATCLFGLAAFLACVVPARHAMRVDPIAALRCE